MGYHTLPATFVSHVALNVSHLERSLIFYKQVLGFRVFEHTNNRVSLTAGNGNPILTLYEIKDTEPNQGESSGLYHIALLLPSRRFLAELYIYARENEVLFEGAADHLTSESVYLSDPDGNGLEIYADRPSSEWMWKNGRVAIDLIPLDTKDLLQETVGEWKGIPPGSRIGHVHLRVRSLEESTCFYTRYFPYQVVSKYGSQAIYLSTEKYHHHIALNTWKNGVFVKGASFGIRSFTLAMTAQQRICTLRKLRADGYEVDCIGEHYIVEDPVGNTIFF
ncbi:MAG TPA: VOC family protein [Bacillota bacterium]|nr:VOC family protein [Bacillota bacterium]